MKGLPVSCTGCGGVGVLQGMQLLRLSSMCHPSNESPFPRALHEAGMPSQQTGPLQPPPLTPAARHICCFPRANQHPSKFLLWTKPSFAGPKYLHISAPSFPSQPHAGLRHHPSPQQPRTGASPSMPRHSPEDAFGLCCLLSSLGTISPSWKQEVNTSKAAPKGLIGKRRFAFTVVTVTSPSHFAQL